jgi:hypothetical protein
MRILAIFLALQFLMSCASMNKLDEYARQRALRQMEEAGRESDRRAKLWEEGIEKKLKRGMAVDEFERAYKNDIYKRANNGNVFYFWEPGTKNKSRVTFREGRLIKYENFAFDLRGVGWMDYTWQLESAERKFRGHIQN